MRSPVGNLESCIFLPTWSASEDVYEAGLDPVLPFVKPNAILHEEQGFIDKQRRPQCRRQVDLLEKHPSRKMTRSTLSIIFVRFDYSY
jgi:hypothetical protein